MRGAASQGLVGNARGLRRVGLLAGAPLVFALSACASAPPPLPPPPPRPLERPAPPPPPKPPPVRIEIPLGAVSLVVSHSLTAQTFHVVDELAGWDAVHRAPVYAAWAKNELALDDADRAALARHAKLRARRGAGAMDQAFLVDDAIDAAAKRAVDAHLLSPADAEDERTILVRFGAKLAPLFDAQKANVEALQARIAEVAPRVAPLANEVARFLGSADALRVPVFLVSDPSPTRADGVLRAQIVAVEVLARKVDASDARSDRIEVDALATFFHAVFHAVLAHKRESIAIAGGKCDEPVDDETMTEGLVYAIAPGLVSHLVGAEGDPLATMVARDRDRPLRVAFVRDERLGLALRTDLASALEGGHTTLHEFFPSACDAWAKVAAAAR